MNKKSEILQVRITSEMSQWFDILERKYGVKRCHFVREAIIEKFKKDTPKLRTKKERMPF